MGVATTPGGQFSLSTAAAALRVDLPFYELEGKERTAMTYTDVGYQYSKTPAGKSMYVAPISLTIALSFH